MGHVCFVPHKVSTKIQNAPLKCVLLPMLLKFYRRNKSNKKG